jgi:hypothetical protein
MSIDSSFFTIAGLLFGRGSLLNPCHNNIVLFFLNEEKEYMENILIKLEKYEPEIKKLPFKSLGIEKTVNCIHIPARYGRMIKETLDFQRYHIEDRKVPNRIISAELYQIIDFLSGYFSMNGIIEKRGIFFFRYPVIVAKDTSVLALNTIRILFNRISIDSEVKIHETNKELYGELIIKKEEVLQFASKIKILNPIKSNKLAKLSNSYFK